jgi:hypothetical protein
MVNRRHLHYQHLYQILVVKVGLIVQEQGVELVLVVLNLHLLDCLYGY